MALLVMAGVAPVRSAAPVAAATPEGTYVVWTWNVAGWKIHHGATSDGLVTTVTDSIRNRGAHLVALNELCLSQYEAIRTELRDSGWPQDGENFSHFEQLSERGCRGEPFGLALFSRSPLGPAESFPLSPDGSVEERQLLCAPLRERPHLRFCTTHITPSGKRFKGQTLIETQLNDVLDQLETFESGGDTVIIAGDFNVQPNDPRLDPWYSFDLDTPNNSNNMGDYRELDDTDPRCPGYGESTMADGNSGGACHQGRKIDMIFVRENHIVGHYEAEAVSPGNRCRGLCSDHKILVGMVAVTVAP